MGLFSRESGFMVNYRGEERAEAGKTVIRVRLDLLQRDFEDRFLLDTAVYLNFCRMYLNFFH